MPYTRFQNTCIHYRDEGAGTPIVALHGSASTGKQWESLTGYLSGRFRVIRPDLPGYGKSSHGGGGTRNLAETADALSTLFTELGEPVHLVGHSFGGAVALKIASILPHMVRSLVVIEPAAFHLFAQETGGRGHLRELMCVVASMRAACAKGEDGTAMAQFIDFWNGDGAWARTSDGLRQKLTAATMQVMDDFSAIYGESASFADYATIACPVLAVTGRLSPLVTQHLTERIAYSIPTATLAEIVDAGHMAPLTDPHVIDPMIAGHLLASEERGCLKGGEIAIAA